MPHELTLKTVTLPAEPEGIVVLYTDPAAGPAPALAGEAARLWAQTGHDLEKTAAAARFAGKPGEMLDLIAPPGLEIDRLLIVGAPASDTTPPSPTARSDQGGALMARLRALKAETVTVVPGETLSVEEVADFAAGLKLRDYKFDRYKTTGAKTDAPKPMTVALAVADKKAADAAIAVRDARAEGTILARDLMNEPPNVLDPQEFASRLREFSKLGIDVDVLDVDEMQKLGMGALLAVGQGSSRPARLVVMQWNGGKKGQKPVAFVGKGVVFDTGGISIKPAGNMENMKGDMGGAAAVAGTMKALALRKAKVNAVGVVGLVENMPDGNAYRPGDIVTTMSGQTLEIVNTDAEGRLVLADALWYTRERFDPRAMIDLATLTGAIMVGLGQDYAGLFSNDDDLAAQLFAAGTQSGEKVWRMPMGAAYDKLIDSRFADMKNTGGRFGGAITAAQLLKRFVGEVPWAHLDIAGAGLATPGTDTNTSWSPGFGVALLDQFVADSFEG